MQSIQSDRKAPARGIRGAVRLGIVALVSVASALAGASACLDRPICPNEKTAAQPTQPCKPQTTNIFVDTITQNSVDKIDLLFMIDNSISMADKQKVLAAAVPDLVSRLVSPNCVDADGKSAQQIKDPLAACPQGLLREFTPISNIHIGVITSSLGDHGDHNTCNGIDGTPDITAEQQDDHGHLIATRPRFKNATIGQPPEALGFLDWNPATHANQDINAFNTTFGAMVTSSSEFGCGLESQLEAIYRFISDPNPPQTIQSAPCPGTTAAQKQPCATPTGKDTDVIAQRTAFLRPDSLVALVMVTDENDCSIRDTQQFFYAARQDIVLPNGTSVCATNPNDRCCVSCAARAPDGCTPVDQDPNCKATPNPDLDSINLRCFNEKQRFGLDFLYPTKRYVNMLKSTQLCTSNVNLDYDPANPNGCPDADGNGQPDVVSNALYFNQNGLPRSSDLVFFAGIVGVPWQDIQAKTDKNGVPFPANELHFLTATDMTNNKTWDTILGDPTASPPVLPVDGLMVESRSARNGSTNATADGNTHPIPGPGATQADDFGPAATANHHEWGNIANDDLMYACVFKLAETRDCLQVEKADPAPGCDCGSTVQPGDNNPLCRDPNSGAYGNTQFFAKAYPGLRELQVLKDYGKNSIIASICARNLDTNTAQDYGYRPAVDAIVDRLKEALTGRCLPRKLAKGTDGKYPCSILEVQQKSVAPTCDPGRGRLDPASVGHSKVIQPAKARLQEAGVCGVAGAPTCDSFSFCEIQWLGPPTAADDGPCHKNIANPNQPLPGWCYVAPGPNSPDDPTLVAKCPPADKQIIRFVDPESKTPAQGSQVLIACFGAQLGED